MITRRLVVLLAFTAAAASLACTPDRRSDAKEGRADTLGPPVEPLIMKGAAPGQRGGRFIAVGTNAPQTFNPVTATTSYSGEINAQLFAGLTRLDSITQQDTPMLATSWDIAPDGRSVTYHLRHGASFSDGHPITADDVLFSAQLVVDPSAAATSRDLLMFKGTPLTFEAPDPYTFIARCDQPDSNLFTSVADAVVVVPRHVLAPAVHNGSFNSSYSTSTPPNELVTSGPWRLKEYLPNERTVLTRNPYWFGTDSRGTRLPYLDELIYVIVPDRETADLKFRAGEVDMIADAPLANYQWYEEHQREGHFTFHNLGVSLNPSFLFFNLNVKNGQPAVGPTKFAWFNNPLFRRAVSKAINRDALIQGPAFFGNGSKSWAYSTPGDEVWRLPDIPHDDYDRAGAIELLRSIGMSDRDGDGVVEDRAGNPVTFALKTTGTTSNTVNFLREDLADVGIKLTLATADFNTISANVYGDFQYDATTMARTVGRPGPAWASAFWRSTGRTPWRVGRTTADSAEQARIDALLDNIASTNDHAQQMAWWRELHSIANAQAWVIWLPVRTMKAPVRDRFGNLRPAVFGGGTYTVLWNSEEIFAKPTP